MDHELEPVPQSHIPFISEEVRERVLEEAGLKPGTSIHTTLNGLRDLAESTLIDVAQVNYPFVETLATTLREKPSTSHRDTDGFVKGVSIVLRAYQLATEGSLIENLSRLEESDIEEMQVLIRHGDKMAQYGVPIIERVIAEPRLPEQQVNLRQCVQIAARQSDYLESSYIKVGAAIMYKVLSKNWPKLMGKS